MHHNLTPSFNTKKYQERIINNFHSRPYHSDFNWSQAHLSQDSSSLQYGRSNAIDITGGSNLTGLDYATILDFESLFKNNFSGDTNRERKKNKLMKVCVDRSRSALNRVLV